MTHTEAPPQPPSTNAHEGEGALAGVRVIDLTRMLSGPYCTMLLGDQGAEVIKVESLDGDTSRGHGPYRTDDPDHRFGGYFQSVNRNKKSIVLNLKDEQARDVLRKLVATADILVENYRSGVMERLGLGYEDLRAINPKLVYAAIRGFGDARSGASPYEFWPAYDVVAQAMGGIIGITGPGPGQHVKIGPGVGDIFPGTLTTVGILCALHRAQRTGKGQFVDVAMYDAVLALCERIVYQHSFAGIEPQPEGSAHPFFSPFGLYEAADGWVTIACPNDGFWATLAQAMGRPELVDDERTKLKVSRARHASFVNDIVQTWTRQYTKSELATLLGGKVPFGPVHTVTDIFADPHVHARGMLAEVEHPGASQPSIVANTPIHLSETPGGVRARAPYFGEHTVDILQQLGFGGDVITGMRERGALIDHDTQLPA
ncbi:CoA transferase [Pusillimonas sp. TS35]|nr:CoA transferase [Paracandidimonas lactea]MYN13897.1 CoA transferase [Pusillimonas sp. TS35]